MGLIATRDKRDKLRLLFEDSKSGAGAGSGLKKVLMDALRACDQVAPNGTWLSGSGEAGGSISLSVLQDMSPVQARRLIGELVDLYDKVVAYLACKGTEATDEAIFNQMMGVSVRCGPRLVRVSSVKQDYSGLRYGVGLTARFV